MDRFLGKPTENHLVDAKIDMQEPEWLKTIRQAVRGPGGERVIETTATPEPKTRCECGCGHPTNGGQYLNEAHRAHAERKTAALPAPEPATDDDDFVEEDPEGEGYLFVWPPVA